MFSITGLLTNNGAQAMNPEVFKGHRGITTVGRAWLTKIQRKALKV